MLDSVERTTSRVAPAKINLALHVTGRRHDGYHLLESLVVFANFGDRVSVKRSLVDRFEISGPFRGDLPEDETNLVIKARNALRNRFPGKADPVAIHLEKHLPISSGIGGGSSDAAAALRALAAHWNIEPNGLSEIGLRLGADVPMCLEGKPLIARGIGDEIEPIGAFPHLPMVLVNIGISISTPQVFAALDRRDNPPLPLLTSIHSADDVCAYLAATENHLFSAAEKLCPSIGVTLVALQGTGARLVRMSGSGGTCFAIYRSDEDAQAAAASLRQRHPDWFVAATYCAAEGG
jgi:4-diphosphocytidyl-2-C-methyl-D-erythritol kinase